MKKHICLVYCSVPSKKNKDSNQYKHDSHAHNDSHDDIRSLVTFTLFSWFTIWFLFAHCRNYRSWCCLQYLDFFYINNGYFSIYYDYFHIFSWVLFSKLHCMVYICIIIIYTKAFITFTKPIWHLAWIAKDPNIYTVLLILIDNEGPVVPSSVSANCCGLCISARPFILQL